MSFLPGRGKSDAHLYGHIREGLSLVRIVVRIEGKQFFELLQEGCPRRIERPVVGAVDQIGEGTLAHSLICSGLKGFLLIVPFSVDVLVLDGLIGEREQLGGPLARRAVFVEFLHEGGDAFRAVVLAAVFVPECGLFQ